MTQYWGGGTKQFFLLILYNFGNIWGARAPPCPPPPLLRGPCGGSSKQAQANVSLGQKNYTSKTRRRKENKAIESKIEKKNCTKLLQQILCVENPDDQIVSTHVNEDAISKLMRCEMAENPDI